MSGVGTGTAMLVGSGLSAGGSIASGIMGSNAAQDAASVQAKAADKAATLQANLGQESLNYENNQYQQARADEKPWLQSGADSLATMKYLMGMGSSTGATGNGNTSSGGTTLSIPGATGSTSVPGVSSLNGTASTNAGAFGSLMAPYSGGTFQAPTAAAAASSPGEKFALQQGENAVQASAAANGSLLTGGTQAALNQYAQGMASTNYNNVYNRALQTYNTNYNTWANQNATKYNELAGLSSGGQTAAQTLSNAGSNAANQVGNTLTNTGKEVGQQYNNSAAATASGYVGSANALGGAVSNSANSLSQMMQLSSLMKGGSGYSNPYSTLGNAKNNSGLLNEGTGNETLFQL